MKRGSGGGGGRGGGGKPMICSGDYGGGRGESFFLFLHIARQRTTKLSIFSQNSTVHDSFKTVDVMLLFEKGVKL